MEPKKLDYTLQSPLDRSNLVKEIINTADPKQLTEKYLEILSDYIIFAMDKQERKERNILTENRIITVNKRETSMEALALKFENGEDGIHNIINNDKNQLLSPKMTITKEDIEEIPPLNQLKEAIAAIEQIEKTATGKKKYLLKKQLIEMRQNQYIIKTEYKSPICKSNAIKAFCRTELQEEISFDENGEPVSSGLISFFNPKHISVLLCNYSALKEESWGNFTNDCYYLMEDLDALVERTLKDRFPLYYELLILKIDGRQNAEIQSQLKHDFNIWHSVEYISSLWRNKIPKLLAEQAKEDYLNWYYTTQEYGAWKKCSRCGQIKLAHNKFFSKNKTSKDSYYSICKECRNKKTTQEK